MRQQTVFRTLDGLAHNTQKLALEYIDKRQGGHKAKLAHLICNADKYTAACSLIDSLDFWRIIVDIQMWERDKTCPDLGEEEGDD